MNDNDCCTEAIELLADVWEWTSRGGDLRNMPVTRNKIGALLVAKGIIDVDIDPPDESNRNLEGEDL